MPSPARVAAAFLRSAYAEYKNLSDEGKATVMGAWVFYLRDRVNNRSTFMVKRPKDVRFKAVDDRIEVKDFPVPEVAWIEYDSERREVRVLNRGGTVLAKSPVHAPLDYTTVAQKNFGKTLGSLAHHLLIEIKANEPGRTEQRVNEEKAEKEQGESLRQKMIREKKEEAAAELVKYKQDQAKRDEERVRQERRQVWLDAHIWGPELVAGLARVGIKGTHQDKVNYTGGIVWIDGMQLHCFTIGEGGHGFAWSLSAGSDYGNLPDGVRAYEGRVPDMPKEKAIPIIANAVKDALKKIEIGAAKKKLEEEKAEAEQVWSVARDGYMLEEAGEGDEDNSQGYIAEVETFNSKEKALAYARDIAPCYLVKGTQMWNEPVGQTEEDDRPHGRAWYKLIQGERERD